MAEDPRVVSWVYTPIKDGEAAETWAMHSLEVVHEFVDPNDFVQSLTQHRSLPFIHPDGSQQYFRCYILVLPNGEFGLFTFGTHAILDAHPNLNLLNLLLQSVNEPEKMGFKDLPWGEEWKNLPPGTITATGGPRDGWASGGAELIGSFHDILSNPVVSDIVPILRILHSLYTNSTKPTHTLRPCRLTVTKPGMATRIHRVLDRDMTKRILASLREKQYSVTQLAEASFAIATFEYNPDLTTSVEDAHVTLDGSL